MFAFYIVFVVQRVYILWGHNKRVLAMVAPMFVLVYSTSFVSAGIGERVVVRLFFAELGFSDCGVGCYSDEQTQT
jgi:hypothetical protein